MLPSSPSPPSMPWLSPQPGTGSLTDASSSSWGPFLSCSSWISCAGCDSSPSSSLFLFFLLCPNGRAGQVFSSGPQCCQLVLRRLDLLQVSYPTFFSVFSQELANLLQRGRGPPTCGLQCKSPRTDASATPCRGDRSGVAEGSLRSFPSAAGCSGFQSPERPLHGSSPTWQAAPKYEASGHTLVPTVNSSTPSLFSWATSPLRHSSRSPPLLFGAALIALTFALAFNRPRSRCLIPLVPRRRSSLFRPPRRP